MAVSSRPEDRAGFALKRAPRQKLAETVAQQLFEAIRDLPPGTRVPPERELTKELGVGRSTVREALNGLALMGVVDIRHGQGVFVAERPHMFARAFVIGTGARFVLKDCRGHDHIWPELKKIILSVHRFGCATVYELEKPSELVQSWPNGRLPRHPVGVDLSA